MKIVGLLSRNLLARLSVNQPNNCTRLLGTTCIRQRKTSRSIAELARDHKWKPGQGTEGERFYQISSVQMEKVDAQMPTLEINSQLFNGIRYDHLPICQIRCSKNNTLIRFTNKDKELITKTSCGIEGFKNAKKKTTVAGQATGMAAAARALRRNVGTVRVMVRGLGPGRLSAVKGLALGGLTVVSITDFTPLPELGPRPKKERRI